MSIHYTPEGDGLHEVIRDALFSAQEAPTLQGEITGKLNDWINEHYQAKEGPIDWGGTAAVEGSGAVG